MVSEGTSLREELREERRGANMVLTPSGRP